MYSDVDGPTERQLSACWSVWIHKLEGVLGGEFPVLFLKNIVFVK